MIPSRYGAVLLLSVVLSCTNDRIRSDESPAENATRFAVDHDAAFLVDRLNHDIYWVSTEILPPYVASFIARSRLP